jgi:hypothetical protein
MGGPLPLPSPTGASVISGYLVGYHMNATFPSLPFPQGALPPRQALLQAVQARQPEALAIAGLAVLTGQHSERLGFLFGEGEAHSYSYAYTPTPNPDARGCLTRAAELHCPEAALALGVALTEGLWGFDVSAARGRELLRVGARAGVQGAEDYLHASDERRAASIRAEAGLRQPLLGQGQGHREPPPSDHFCLR